MIWLTHSSTLAWECGDRLNNQMGERAVQFDTAPTLTSALGALPRNAIALFPVVAGLDWPTVLANVNQPLIFVRSPFQAAKLCMAGQPSIAMSGVSEGKLAKWLRKRGARVNTKVGAH